VALSPKTVRTLNKKKIKKRVVQQQLEINVHVNCVICCHPHPHPDLQVRYFYSHFQEISTKNGNCYYQVKGRLFDTSEHE